MQAREEALRRIKRKRRGAPDGPMKAGTVPKPKMSMADKFRLEQRKRLMNKRRDNLPGGMLTGGQAKIAAKAPPTNKIDAKDFAVLRAEKAKGRGKGLQDEKMKPGKIIKAKKSKFIERRKNLAGLGSVLRKDPTKAINRVGVKDRYGMDIKPKTSQLGKDLASQAAKAAKATRIGKIAAGVAGVALAAKAGLEKMYEKRTGKKPFTKRPEKKMGGGMMKKPMGYDEGGLQAKVDRDATIRKARASIDKIKSKEPKRNMFAGMSNKQLFSALASKANPFNYDRLTSRDIQALKDMKKNKKMGGGMMMRPNPVGYKTGKSVKVKCKLGRNKPTKMY